MGAMRRVVLAILLCAAPLTAAPAYASQDLLGLEALRAAGVRALPLADDGPIASVASAGELTRIAAARGPVRVLVGVRRHGDVAGVARLLRRLGATPRRLRLDRRAGRDRARRRGARAIAGQRQPRGLRGARRQAARGRRPARRGRSEHRGQVHLVLRRRPRRRRPGRRRRRLAALDRRDGHRPRREPPRVRRPHRPHLRHLQQGDRRDRHGRPRHVRHRPDRRDRRQRHRRQGRGRQHPGPRDPRLQGRRLHHRATCCAASSSPSGAARTSST